MIHTSAEWAPHGVCWLWDWRVILLHSPADLVTFLAYAVISLTAVYVYRVAIRSGVAVLYPRLWLLGAAFIGTCGLSHLGNSLEVFYGGQLYWLTGCNKLVMATVSAWFAIDIWRVRETIVMVFLAMRDARTDDNEGDI